MNEKINRDVTVKNLGLIDYQKAWDYQEDLFRHIVEIKISNRKSNQKEITPNYLLLCQHPHVYTLGKSGKKENLLIDEAEMVRSNISYYRINRGGDITYHGPGQIVGYPILDLENFFTDIHKYLRLLEEAIILTLRDYGLEGGRIEGLTGVWLDFQIPQKARKICAIGVRTSRWVSMHGFAFNINTDLTYFENIVPCGIKDKDVTSLAKELNKPVDPVEVEDLLLSNLSELFSMHLLQEENISENNQSWN